MENIINTHEKETHDFMNVESFSQLPFIRPANLPVKEKGIRLFGKEFGGSDLDLDKVATVDESNSQTRGEYNTSTTIKEDNGSESNRKFECHYCCRNFPTSQALGGHQNAHKRERQNAKRAHLQSAMVHGGYPEAHVYGLMNYHRFGSAPSPPALAYHQSASSFTSNINNSFYGGHGSNSYTSTTPQHQQPITGNPLALWRVPSVHNSPSYNYERDMNHQPLFANNKMETSLTNIGSSSSQNRYVYESKASVKDHVSLDLHL